MFEWTEADQWTNRLVVADWWFNFEGQRLLNKTRTIGDDGDERRHPLARTRTIGFLNARRHLIATHFNLAAKSLEAKAKSLTKKKKKKKKDELFFAPGAVFHFSSGRKRGAATGRLLDVRQHPEESRQLRS